MTKTLTEQWREGTLERGYYYYKTKVCAKVIGYQCFGLKFPYDYNHNTIDSVKEVLAPVPSYDEYNGLIQQNVNQESAIETYIERIKELEEENKNLKEQIHSMLFTDDVVQERYDKSVQKMHILEQQLKEANELLKAYGTESLWESLSLSCDEANEYCKKWGVK